jgi:hypothetical protein
MAYASPVAGLISIIFGAYCIYEFITWTWRSEMMGCAYQKDGAKALLAGHAQQIAKDAA